MPNMIQAINKIKLRCLAAFLFVSLIVSCASHNYTIMTVDIRARCIPYVAYKIENVSLDKINVTLTRYKQCLGFKDLLVFRWDKYNTTAVRVVAKQVLQRYIKMEKMTAELIQWEQWGDGFYVLYELKER